MSRKPWSTLREPIMADPVRRAHIEEMSRASRLVIALARLCDSQSETPPGATTATDGSQPEVPHITEDDSLFLATLKEGIEELGGRLEVTAVFPDQRVPLLG